MRQSVLQKIIIYSYIIYTYFDFQKLNLRQKVESKK